MTIVYLLYHIRDEDTDDEDVKMIGIYSSAELAEQAKERGQDKPGFVDFPEGFSIFPCKLNRDGWVDGFIT